MRKADELVYPVKNQAQQSHSFNPFVIALRNGCAANVCSPRTQRLWEISEQSVLATPSVQAAPECGSRLMHHSSRSHSGT